MKREKIMVTVVCVLTSFALATAGISGCSKGDKSAKDKPANVTDESGSKSLDVTVYAYCPCAKCNTEKWKGMVSTGQKMKKLLSEGKNICAADTDVIPMGSTVTYDGKDYVVADTGRRIKGNTINILLKNHKEVYAFGVKKGVTVAVEK